MEDEDRMIAKLEEHREIKLMVKEIGELYGIEVTSTVDNDPNGDFLYPEEQERQLIDALDRFLGHRKHRRSQYEECG